MRVLSDRHPSIVWPARSTVDEILVRNGLVQPRRRRTRWDHPRQRPGARERAQRVVDDRLQGPVPDVRRHLLLPVDDRRPAQPLLAARDRTPECTHGGAPDRCSSGLSATSGFRRRFARTTARRSHRREYTACASSTRGWTRLVPAGGGRGGGLALAKSLAQPVRALGGCRDGSLVADCEAALGPGCRVHRRNRGARRDPDAQAQSVAVREDTDVPHLMLTRRRHQDPPACVDEFRRLDQEFAPARHDGQTTAALVVLTAS